MFYKKRLFPLLVFLLVAFLVTACSNSPQSAQRKIDKIAQDMQAELPKMLDNDTRLVDVHTGKLELVSAYELVNYEPTEAGNKKIISRIELYLKRDVCPGIKKELLNRGISSRYIYKSKDGQVIINSVLAPGDC